MLSNQTISSPIFWHLLQAAAAALDRTAKTFRNRWEAAQQRQKDSKLSPHLRYDIGEVDCLPPPSRPLAEMLQSHPETLETMWMRSFR